MLFNSLEFLVFFPVVVLIFFWLPHKYRWAHLLLASCYFYMAFVPKYIAIIGAIIIIDYCAAIFIEKSAGRKRRMLVITTVLVNIIILCTFKYYYFFISDVSQLLNSSFSFPLVLLFPIGLSFQTFQALSYIFEVDKGTIKAEKHLGIYALYILFFPKQVAGPIERPQNMIPQFRQEKFFDSSRVLVGLKIILWGFFKKLVIADRLAIFVSDAYRHPEDLGTLNLWIAVFIFFPVQLYCDFSGYTSIAIGSAKVLGFDLMENFKRPFLSLTASEFWNRWHISLSTWLRDYVYQPLVIVLRDYGKWAVVIGLMATFFVSGVWHGAGLSFIIYGLIQGTIIVVEFLLGIKSTKLAKSTFGRIRGITTTYLLWAFSLIFFRAKDLEQAVLIVKKMFWEVNLSFTPPVEIPGLNYILSMLLIGFLLYFESKKGDRFLYQRNTVARDFALGCCMVIVLFTFGVFHNLSFIYFQF
jgi:D-alanyl-lipoteichoic acid acyltransferase DltB (MBOAT superfamily)